MVKVLSIVNGVPRMVDAVAGGAVYEEVIVIDSNLPSGGTFTLPSSKTYSDKELEVFLNDGYLEVGEDYNYLGTAPNRTQISVIIPLVNTDRLRFRIARDA